MIADDDLHEFATQLLQNADTVLFGRMTYMLLANYWPIATSDPSLPQSMVRFANTINPMPKIVFSKSLVNVGWNTQVIKSVNPADITKMKARTGQDMVLLGGSSITQAFIHHSLIDEFQLLVQPVEIGDGKSLFKGIEGMHKRNLIWSKSFHSGSVALCYLLDGGIETNRNIHESIYLPNTN